jgi:hypothetical protein
MIKHMIQSAVKMLQGIDEPKVACAKLLLEGIVAELEGEIVSIVSEVKKETKEKKDEVGYEVVLNEDNTLNRVLVHANGKTVELGDTRLMKIDGETIAYSSAKGKRFTKGEVL